MPANRDSRQMLSNRQLSDLSRGLEEKGRHYLFSRLLEEGSFLSEAGDDRKTRAEPTLPQKPLHSRKRSAALALVSVMLCDGTILPSERAFVDRFLVGAGEAPLQPDEIRAWQPAELSCPENAESAVEALACLTHLDTQPDRSEWQLVREFALAWRVGEGKLKEIEERFGKQSERKASLRGFLAALRRLIGID